MLHLAVCVRGKTTGFPSVHRIAGRPWPAAEGGPFVVGKALDEAFGRWVTPEENKWFTVAVANRLWKQTMGVGLIEPVDNIKYDTVSQIPALMNLLEDIMKQADYNLKDFLRILYNTQTWQMETLTTDLPENLADYHYAG